jgi:hypothetical protein
MRIAPRAGLIPDEADGRSRADVPFRFPVLAPPAGQLGTHPKRYWVFRANSTNDIQQAGKAGRKQ